MTSPEASAGAPALSSAQAPRRPGLRLLLWYSIGGSLPTRYNTWVLHDVTCRTWVLRHFVRVFALIVPISALFFGLLVPTYGAPMAYAGICLTGTLFLAGLTTILIDTDRRAVRAGYLSDYASEVRSRRATETQHTSNYERRERIAARKARRFNKH
jgi:Family of unknown function (DUF5313)